MGPGVRQRPAYAGESKVDKEGLTIQPENIGTCRLPVISGGSFLGDAGRGFSPKEGCHALLYLRVSGQFFQRPNVELQANPDSKYSRFAQLCFDKPHDMSQILRLRSECPIHQLCRILRRPTVPNKTILR